jgi:hypothetical protein
MNPELTSINRLPSRSPLVPFDSVDNALRCDDEESHWYRGLNGRWRFESKIEYAGKTFTLPLVLLSVFVRTFRSL